MLVRKKPKIDQDKYANVVADLSILSDLGFAEGDNHIWRYTIHEDEFIEKHIIASGNCIFYNDSEKDNSGSTVVLWDRKESGKEISKLDLSLLISLICKGNGK